MTEWYCVAEANGLTTTYCSPENPIHSGPDCGWTGYGPTRTLRTPPQGDPMPDSPTPIELADDEILTKRSDLPDDGSWEYHGAVLEWIPSRPEINFFPHRLVIARPVRRMVSIDARHLKALETYLGARAIVDADTLTAYSAIVHALEASDG